MLYLLKASRIREYHQQNVAILGAEEGERFTVAYGYRWMQLGVRPQVGDGCVIVFSDGPYERFVPVRFAKVRRFAELDDRVEIEVSVGPHVRDAGTDLLGARWAGRTDDERPGRRFLFVDEDPGLSAAQSPDGEVDSWRAVCDRLAANAYFRQSVFARVVRVLDADGAPLDPARLVVGAPLEVELELRSPQTVGDTVQIAADAEPPGVVAVPAGLAVASRGAARVPFRVLIAGTGSMFLRFLPEPLLSSRPAVGFDAREPRVGEPAAEPVGAHPARDFADRLVRLVTRLERDAAMPDAVWVGVLEDELLPWAPGNGPIHEAYARHACAMGEYAKAGNALASLEQRSPEGEALLVIASLRAGLPFDAGQLLPRLDFTGEQPFAELLEALDNASETTWLEFLDLLPHSLLGDDKSHAFLLRASKCVRHPDACLRIAEGLAYVDAEEAAAFLLERFRDPETAPVEVVDLLLQFGSHRTHLLPYVEARLGQLAAAEQWYAIENLRKRAQAELRDEDRYFVTARCGRLMLRSDDRTIADRGFELSYEAAIEASRLGDLDTALRAATIAHAYAARRNDEDFAETAAQLKEQLEEVIRETEIFRRYEEAQVDDIERRARVVCEGKLLHIVGGREADWADDLRATVGASELRWHASDKSKGPNLQWTDGLAPNRDLVVVLTDYIGHATTEPLHDICARRRVPYIPTQQGRASILRALAEADGADE